MDKKINKLSKIYKSSQDDVVLNYLVPSFFIIFFFVNIVFMYIKADLLEGKTEWTKSMCVPKYMFISGFLNKKPKETILGSTYDNFLKCVDKYKRPI